MVNILRRLALALKPFAEEYQPVLYMDALRSHLATSVLNALSACHLWPVIVPAGMTHELQPLDTHCFSAFKNSLRGRYAAARGRHLHGDVPMPVFVGCVRESIDEVIMGRQWSSAFQHNGFGHNQASVARRLWESVGLQAHESVSWGAPTLTQIQLCLPRSAGIAAAIIWRRFVQEETRLSHPDVAVPGAARACASSLGHTECTRPISSRTRSKSSCAGGLLVLGTSGMVSIATRCLCSRSRAMLVS